MTTTGRIMSPEAAFAAVLRQAQAADSPSKATITVTEAKHALTQLEGHPSADASERARVVQQFLDSKEGKALSPKAREAFQNFVSAQGKAAGGTKATELKADALKNTNGAEFQLDQARGHVAALLAKGMVGKGELAQVTTALDKALASVADARKSLTGLLKVADHTAKLADDQLQTAGGDLQQAKNDVAALVARAKGGAVTKAQLKEVQTWLDAPKANLDDAQAQLGGGRSTRKFPSDNEDGGFNGGGPGGGAMTLKFPSDNEDGGPQSGGGGVMHTMKAPSDNEDGGPDIHPLKPEARPQVSKARTEAMIAAYNSAKNVAWHNSMPLGQRFESVPLMREKHPDGFAYEAMIPVGALTPTAPRTDPNKVDTFWVRRTGGLAGLTQYAGPFTLGKTAG